MDDRLQEKYNRHIILPEIGVSGQERILKAKVLIVGAGGLGAPVLLYLAAAGVGTIGIVDNDVVSLSNLQRQILYKEEQCGQSKAEYAKDALQALNKDTVINTFPIMLDEENAESIIRQYNIVVGTTDNFKSRYLIDSYSRKYNIPFVHGSIDEFQGQVSVFNYQNGPSYSELYPDVPAESEPRGVMGILPGVIGSMQAIEVIKIIVGIGEVLSGKLLIYDALKTEFTTVEF